MKRVLALAVASMWVALSAPHAMAAPAADVVPSALADRWSDYKHRHLDPSGRLVDNANRGISHSEGQGYGLVLAAFLKDRPAFDAIRAFARAELAVDGSGLFAWRYDPAADPRVGDPNNATDGDLLVAWGLALGADRWSDESLREEARAIARAIWQEATVQTRFGRVLLPGRMGFTAKDRPDGPVVNLSYWVFPALRALQPLTPEIDWRGVEDSGRALLQTARFGPRRLPTDWISLAGDSPQPATGFKPVFGYEGVRIPLYLALLPDAVAFDLRPLDGYLSLAETVGPSVVEVPTGIVGERLGGNGYRLVLKLAGCVASGGNTEDPAAVSAAPIGDDLYYPATLGLLALIGQSQGHGACL